MQTLALISDIHGNAAAFETVLAEIRTLAPDHAVCLGDVAATGPAPGESLALLREQGWPVVRGNTDDTLLQMAAGKPFDTTDPHLAIDKWCADQLSSADIAFLASFQPVVQLEAEGVMICCYHGSPRSYDDQVLSETDASTIDHWFHGQHSLVYAGGHTHIQMIRRRQESFIVNPGSVGLPFTYLAEGRVVGPPWAEYGLVRIDGPRVSIELRRIPIDRDRVIAQAVEHEMPHLNWWSGGGDE